MKSSKNCSICAAHWDARSIILKVISQSFHGGNLISFDLPSLWEVIKISRDGLRVIVFLFLLHLLFPRRFIWKFINCFELSFCYDDLFKRSTVWLIWALILTMEQGRGTSHQKLWKFSDLKHIFLHFTIWIVEDCGKKKFGFFFLKIQSTWMHIQDLWTLKIRSSVGIEPILMNNNQNKLAYSNNVNKLSSIHSYIISHLITIVLYFCKLIVVEALEAKKKYHHFRLVSHMTSRLKINKRWRFLC